MHITDEPLADDKNDDFLRNVIPTLRCQVNHKINSFGTKIFAAPNKFLFLRRPFNFIEMWSEVHLSDS